MTERNPRAAIQFFIFVAVAWAVVGASACGYFSNGVAELQKNLMSLLGLWLLCLADLCVLGKLLQSLMTTASGSAENRAASAIRAISWGFLKLVCFGIFIIVLMKIRTIPTAGLLLGLGTLAVVPLISGLGVLRHA